MTNRVEQRFIDILLSSSTKVAYVEELLKINHEMIDIRKPCRGILLVQCAQLIESIYD